MLVKVGRDVKDIPVVTINITSDPNDPQGMNLNMFYCPRCQSRVQQYTGRLHSIDNSNAPRLQKNITLYKCRNKRHDFETLQNPKGECGLVYFFQLT